MRDQYNGSIKLKINFFVQPGSACHLIGPSGVQRTGACYHSGGQSLHQQRCGADVQPATAPRSHRPRLLAGRQLLHRQQPHGRGEAQPVGPGHGAEPEATG